MVDAKTIRNAIDAHGAWKVRLRNALSTGKFDGEPSVVRVDNRCDFGKWLYSSELQPADKESEHYRTVKKLHAEFHQEAAKVVEWATSGQKDRAEKSLGLGGPYAKASQELTAAMVRWRLSLHQN